MSGSNNEIANTGGPASSAEPSMEEILASIRRILKDDQPGAPAEAEDEEEILVLDSTMVVKPGTGTPAPVEPAPEFAPSYEPEPGPAGQQGFQSTEQDPPAFVAPAFEEAMQSPPHFDAEPPAPEAVAEQNFEPNEREAGSYHNPANTEVQNMSDDAQENFQRPDGLVSEAVTDAAAGSIGALIRTISSDRQIAIGRANLTLEDLVREELRPLLKAWLDTNLPALVERIVRAEIQRVIERSTT